MVTCILKSLMNQSQFMSNKDIELDEPLLEDDYPIHGDYLYVCDGKVIRCDLMSGTVADLKRDLRSHYKLEAKEIRSCDIAGRVKQQENKDSHEK